KITPIEAAQLLESRSLRACLLFRTSAITRRGYYNIKGSRAQGARDRANTTRGRFALVCACWFS
ncbi:hypothetical protein ACFL6U_29475, partial [Planctomycetota bacterium]